MKLLFLAAIVAAAAEAATLPRAVDRTLYIRSIPEVKGYNSHIYEVLMTPQISSRELDAPPARAVAELRTASGTRVGRVNVEELSSGKLQLRLSVEGLTPETTLGLSVHEDGDCSNPGPVFKPDQPANSVPSPETPAGYLGTFKVDEAGKLALEMEVGPRLALNGHRSILARGLALHPMQQEKQDAAPPPAAVACGVVGRVNVQQQRTRRHHFATPRKH